MSDEILVRECRVWDIDRVLDLWARATETHIPDTPEAVRLRLHRDRELFLLALDGKEVVGSVMAGWDGWRGNMYRLAVDPAYRRRGLAKRLVSEVESRLLARGVRRVSALVLKTSPPAVPFWKDADYSTDDLVVRYFKNLGD